MLRSPATQMAGDVSCGIADGPAGDGQLDPCLRTLGERERADLLLDSPQLGDHLQDALEQLGYDCPEDRANTAHRPARGGA